MKAGSRTRPCAGSPSEGQRHYFARLIEVAFFDPSNRSSAAFFAFRRMWE
jgi:hypothetical protein